MNLKWQKKDSVNLKIDQISTNPSEDEHKETYAQTHQNTDAGRQRQKESSEKQLLVLKGLQYD